MEIKINLNGMSELEDALQQARSKLAELHDAIHKIDMALYEVCLEINQPKKVIVPNIIKKKRKDCGISQRELAEMVGVDRSTVAKWETGVAFPTATKLPQMAEILECSIDELFGLKRPDA